MNALSMGFVCWSGLHFSSGTAQWIWMEFDFGNLKVWCLNFIYYVQIEP
jgi:hypothetical protein